MKKHDTEWDHSGWKKLHLTCLSCSFFFSFLVVFMSCDVSGTAEEDVREALGQKHRMAGSITARSVCRSADMCICHYRS